MQSQTAAPATCATPPQRPIELSIIDLVLAATETSEDESEIQDGIASLIQAGEVRILTRKDDPMLRRIG